MNLKFLILCLTCLSATHDTNEQSNTGQGPETVTEKFVTLLAEGRCDEAAMLSTGEAYETVLAVKDAGCVSYETQIKSTICDVKTDSARCKCVEIRPSWDIEPLQLTFVYYLKLENDVWKVYYYSKDLEYDK